MGLGGVLKKAFSSPRLKKRDFDPEKIDIKDIVLPKIISDFSTDMIVTMVKEEVSTYKSLGYKDKPLEELTVCHYHSFQIGVMIRYFQLDMDILVRNKESVFPSIVLKQDKKIVKHKAMEIVDRYSKVVDEKLDSMTLASDLKWSPLDTAYVLYYLSSYKEEA